jgi:hypothetical protein
MFDRGRQESTNCSLKRSDVRLLQNPNKFKHESSEGSLRRRQPNHSAELNKKNMTWATLLLGKSPIDGNTP